MLKTFKTNKIKNFSCTFKIHYFFDSLFCIHYYAISLKEHKLVREHQFMIN
jgi:hypothetical protein